jgi:hypothetical protein
VSLLFRPDYDYFGSLRVKQGSLTTYSWIVAPNISWNKQMRRTCDGFETRIKLDTPSKLIVTLSYPVLTRG